MRVRNAHPCTPASTGRRSPEFGERSPTGHVRALVPYFGNYHPDVHDYRSEGKPKRTALHPALVTLALLPNLLAWSCEFFLLSDVLREPPDCEVWCTDQGTSVLTALVVLLACTVISFVTMPVLLDQAGRRSKAAWFAVVSTALQPIVFIGLVPVVLRSLRGE